MLVKTLHSQVGRLACCLLLVLLVGQPGVSAVTSWRVAGQNAFNFLFQFQLPPTLLTQDNSTRALALESTTFRAEPFELTQPLASNIDARTRLILFATDLNDTNGNGPSVTAIAEDASLQVFPLLVENVYRLPVADPIYAIHIRLHDEMVADGDVLIQINDSGLESNWVRVGLGRVGGGPPDEVRPPRTINDPVISQLSPSNVGAGTGAFVLQVNGSNFATDSTVQLNGIAISTTFASKTSLSAQVPASDVQTARTYSVTVQRPGQSKSNPATLTITNPLPSVTGLSAINAIKGSTGFVLNVTGSGFVPGSIVKFNGSNRVTAFVSATLLTAQILSTDLGTAGSFPVSVTNSSPGGGDSNGVSFAVIDPAPTPTPTPAPTPLSSPATGQSFYVATDGTSTGDGSSQKPWNLATALRHPAAVKPGDTIWMKAGTYKGTWDSKLTGTAARPIILRAMAGQRVIIDLNSGNLTNSRAFTINGAHTWYWGLEILDSDLVRSTALEGSHPADVPRENSSVTVLGPGIKLINIITHDLSNGVRFWDSAVDSEIYGLITYNNGFHGPERGHGHGIYTQNQTGTKQIREVISFNNFSTGMKAYSESGFANNYVFDGIISFNNGSPEALMPGAELIRREPNLFVGTIDNPQDNFRITNSHLHFINGTYGSNLAIGYQAQGANLQVTDNYISGGFRSLQVLRWTNFSVKRNTIVRYRGKFSRPVFVDFIGNPAAGSIDDNNYYDALPNSDGFAFAAGGTVEPLDAWRLRGFDVNTNYQTGKPGPQVFVRPNAYEKGRANIVVYNWNGGSSASVDLSTTGLALGDDYEIRDAQNFLGSPVFSGKYDGKVISLSLANRVVATPIGMTQTPTHTGPDFFVFVVLRKP